MAVNNVPTKAEVELGDPLTDRIRESILGVETLRAENRRPTDQVKSLEGTNLQLESEVQALKLALDHERAERQHYHLLANEIVTRLDVVGQTIDEVVKRSEWEKCERALCEIVSRLQQCFDSSLPPTSPADPLNRRRIDSEPGGNLTTKISPKQRQLIAKRYAAGETAAALACEFEVGEATIWRALNPGT